MPAQVLQEASENYGVLYPLQSMRKEIKQLPAIPFLTDANNTATKKILNHFAKQLSPQVQQAGDEQRLKFHLNAIFVSNFSNHLYALSEKFCAEEKLDFSLLKPLIKETASRMELYSAAQMQTGPAMRGDTNTLEKHFQLLKNNSSLEKIYRIMTDSILHFYGK
jgi:predicted short-subunit dehydrogenase-like oxidoreductase (DUF2520 family)